MYNGLTIALPYSASVQISSENWGNIPTLMWQSEKMLMGQGSGKPGYITFISWYYIASVPQ